VAPIRTPPGHGTGGVPDDARPGTGGHRLVAVTATGYWWAGSAGTGRPGRPV